MVFSRPTKSGYIAIGKGTRSRSGIAGYTAVVVSNLAADFGLSRRSDWSNADNVFQSASPSIQETSSRLSLWLMLMALWVRESRRVCAIALASRKSRIGVVLCRSEPGVSGGCVADPVARAKGADEGSIRSPFHGGRNRQVVST